MKDIIPDKGVMIFIFDGSEEMAVWLSTYLTQWAKGRGFFGNECSSIYHTESHKAIDGSEIFDGYIKINGKPVYKGQEVRICVCDNNIEKVYVDGAYIPRG